MLLLLLPPPAAPLLLLLLLSLLPATGGRGVGRRGRGCPGEVGGQRGVDGPTVPGNLRKVVAVDDGNEWKAVKAVVVAVVFLSAGEPLLIF